jgi:transcriptional regulator with XRE-family HTH domain
MKERIAKIMEIKKLNATRFADELEIQRSGISHILSGRNKPSLDLIIKIKETYPEFRLDWLLFGHGPVTDASFDIPTALKKHREPDLFASDVDELPGASTKSNADQHVIPAEISLHSETAKIPDPMNGSGITVNKTDNGIERIVLLYKNGTFKVYEP